MSIRLTKRQIHTIVSIIKEFVQPKFQIKLYGSRTRPNTKGGDIDLLLITEKEITPRVVRKIKVKLKDALGEDKIDLTTATFQNKSNFVQLIEDNAVTIWEE